MNFLLTNIHFGVKRFRQFRKKLVLDYKKGDKHAHKNPHAIPLVEKQRLLKVSLPLFSPTKEAIGELFEKCRGKA